MHVAMADYATCRYLGLRSWGLHHCDQHEQSFQMMSIFAVGRILTAKSREY